MRGSAAVVLPSAVPPRAAGRRVVYTCTFLDYDDVFSPVATTPGVEFVLFSDRRPRWVRGWRWRPLPAEVAGMQSSMANRFCKLFPHRLFPDADLSVYVDGNVLLRGDLTPLIEEFEASGAAIGLFIHCDRGSIEEEAAFCRTVGKIPERDVGLCEEQLRTYRAAGLPRPHVMSENGVLFRRHDAPGLDAAMELWWRQLEQFCKRDQISLPYVLHATGLPRLLWSWTYKFDNPYFFKYPHRLHLARRIGTYLYVRSMYGPAHRVTFMTLLRLFGRARDLWYDPGKALRWLNRRRRGGFRAGGKR